MSANTPLTKREMRDAAAPPHAREPWRGDCATVLVHGRLSVMHGTEDGLKLPKLEMKKLYDAAKTQNDMEAAHIVVDAIWREAAYVELRRRVLETAARPIIVSPHPAFDDDDCIDADAGKRHGPRNALPFAYAAQLRIRLNGIANHEIKQGARVGRTKLPRFPKFLFQPHFVGDVLDDRPYIIVDDNAGLGGTLAALRSHIVANGGTVIGVSTLAHSTGKDLPFALTDGTFADLNERYGLGFDDLWKEVVGHGPNCLTEEEGRFLCDWTGADSGDSGVERLQLLRARLDRARATFK